jgi:hypothetical protein
MTTLTATVRNGRLEFRSSIDLPDGTEVEVWLLSPGEVHCVPHDEQPMTPEEIAGTLAAMEKVEPFEMTDEEHVACEAERQARKKWEKAHFEERAEKLRRMWE